jgi:hypothetical protein
MNSSEQAKQMARKHDFECLFVFATLDQPLSDHVTSSLRSPCLGFPVLVSSRGNYRPGSLGASPPDAGIPSAMSRVKLPLPSS